MSFREVPWIIKYRPKRLDEVIDQGEAKKLLTEWFEMWRKGAPEKKAALLHGPAGCGKTSLVEAYAKENKMELIEMNASDFRDKASIERIAKLAASKASLFAPRGKIILLDEIDGLSSVADKGALEAVLDLIETTRNPIVLTANDPWSPQLRPLRDKCLLIPFKRLTKTQIIAALKMICEKEGLSYEVAALNLIAERAEGDLRSAINDLQTLAIGTRRITLKLAEALVSYRYREYTPFDALRKMFWAKTTWQAKAALTSTTLDHEMMKEWINENIPSQYEDPEELWKAYEALSRADVYLGRIVKSGSWDLLSYALDLMSAGVAFARKGDKFKFRKYTFPRRILELAKTKKQREIREDLATILASHLNVSRAIAKNDIIPYLYVIFRENPEAAAKLALAYELSEDQIKYLAGDNANRILRIIDKIRKEEAKATRKGVKKTSEEKTQTSLPF